MKRTDAALPPDQDSVSKMISLLRGLTLLGCAAAFCRELSVPMHLYTLESGANYHWHTLANLSSEHNRAVEWNGLMLSAIVLIASLMLPAFVRWQKKRQGS